MNERGLVEVPENAVREEPIAFGLTAIQLGICALAVLMAALLNLLPVWEPLRVVLVVVGAGPIGLAAALPVRGEPAYRWIVRAVRHRRGRRVWQAALMSVEDATVPIPIVTGASEAGSLQAGDNDDASSQSAEGPGTDVPRPPAPLPKSWSERRWSRRCPA